MALNYCGFTSLCLKIFNGHARHQLIQKKLYEICPFKNLFKKTSFGNQTNTVEVKKLTEPAPQQVQEQPQVQIEVQQPEAVIPPVNEEEVKVEEKTEEEVERVVMTTRDWDGFGSLENSSAIFSGKC